MVNAACGGNILNKTPTAAFEIFSELSEGSRQFSKRASAQAVKATSSEQAPPSMVREVSEMKEMLKVLMRKEGPQRVKECEFCYSTNHATDACPTLHEESTEQVNAVGGYQPRPRYDPYSSTYNPGGEITLT